MATGLEKHNIFTIPVGKYFYKEENDCFLIYAPLSGNMMLADVYTVHKMEQVLQQRMEYREIEELLQTLTDTSETVIETIQHLEDYRVLYVLPNFVCNFSCSYCYSAKGRSNKKLSPEHLKVVLDYFVNALRSKGESLKITFVGGGEPMMSWDLVKQGLEYASSLAGKQGIKLYFGLITNGSIINDEMLKTLSHYHVVPRISFEVLEEIQNKQRGHYQAVCNTIDRLLQAGIYCELRSMITPDNVHRMEEMVMEMTSRFPPIDHYYFDPVTDAEIFHEVEFTKNFYRDYHRSFMKARRRASKNGKEVRNAISRSLESVVERYCNGEFCLTPAGALSICMEVSSPQEEGYEKHIYGYVDENNTLQIDRDKFYFLKDKEMAINQRRCDGCFVKWNCGGGCLASNNRYTKEILDVICEATRELSTELLLERLKENLLPYPNLLKKSIFIIPVEEYSVDSSKDNYLVYAPLTDYVMLADSERLNEMEAAIENNCDNQEGIFPLLERLQNIELYGKKMYSIKKPDDYLLLYILPNYKCNFSCSYCFSGRERSDKELDQNKLKAMLDYFIDCNRVREKKLYITFLGGGEPMLSWKTVKYGIEYAHSRAETQHIRLNIEIVTNGSILNENIPETLVKYNVQVRVSFEALEDVQNLQRSQYGKVCETISRLTEVHQPVELRAMITPLNVERMEEMVVTLIERFPGIKSYFFDPITDKNTFIDVETTRLFCEKYQYHFFKAMDIARHHDKQLICAPMRNMDSLVERYCFGELCLTPEGTITVCHRVSSPSNSNYQNCVYGKINESNKPEFNYEKYQQLMHSDTIYENPDCSHCFVKWNCGGGCMVHNREYTAEIRQTFCDFIRNFSKELLLRRVKNEAILTQYGDAQVKPQ